MTSNIYLSAVGNLPSPVVILAIPFTDIKRLSNRPLKWIKFILFAICGVRGDLSLAANGPPLPNYDDTNLANEYYFTPHGDYHFIDCKATNDRITSSEQTRRRANFRQDIMVRDGNVCVISGEVGLACDAAHIIPKSKGNEYINFIVNDRCHLYNSSPLLDAGINSIENGIFLRKDLHARFAAGDIAFLRTPNYALAPGDIPRVEEGPMPLSRITRQDIELPTGRGLLLDYMYGVAIYKRWGTMENIMELQHTNRYRSIPISPAEPFHDDDDDNEYDDPNDADYEPSQPEPSQPLLLPRQHVKDHNDMLGAMDQVLLLSMLVKGTTPEAVAMKRQKQEEEAELQAQEASVQKVKEWRSESALLPRSFNDTTW